MSCPDRCPDHWHCDPKHAAHVCSGPDRSEPCPTCGDAPVCQECSGAKYYEEDCFTPGRGHYTKTVECKPCKEIDE